MRIGGQKACFLCGSNDLVSQRYLRLNSDSLVRNIGYVIPPYLGKLLSGLNSKFASVYNPVLANKRHFDRELIYCRNCATGYALPFFTDEEV